MLSTVTSNVCDWFRVSGIGTRYPRLVWKLDMLYLVLKILMYLLIIFVKFKKLKKLNEKY